MKCKDCKYLDKNTYIYKARKPGEPNSHPCKKNPSWVVYDIRDACKLFEKTEKDK